MYIRNLWGSTGVSPGTFGGASRIGRSYEERGRRTLEAIGFSDVDWVSSKIPSFPFDYIATLDGQRVLVDATVKIKGRATAKFDLSRSLGMRLFLLHLSPLHEGLHFLNEIQSGCYVIPSSFFHSLQSRDPSYKDTVRMKSEQPCEVCTKVILTGNGTRRRKTCSDECKRESLRRTAVSRGVRPPQNHEPIR